MPQWLNNHLTKTSINYCVALVHMIMMTKAFSRFSRYNSLNKMLHLVDLHKFLVKLMVSNVINRSVLLLKQLIALVVWANLVFHLVWRMMMMTALMKMMLRGWSFSKLNKSEIWKNVRNTLFTASTRLIKLFLKLQMLKKVVVLRC